MDFNKVNATENSGSVESVEDRSDGNKVNVALVKQDQQVAIEQVKGNMASVRDRLKNELISSGEAQALSDTLSVQNPQSIVEFGKQAAENISKCADSILRRQDSSQLTQSNEMFAALSKVMKKVDMKELKDIETEPSFFDKLFNSAQRKLEAVTTKYNNIGNDIEKICIELRTYESQIEQSNKDIESLYNSGIQSYQELLKYTIAGEYAIEEVDSYLNSLKSRGQDDPNVAMEINNVNQAKQLLEQRVQDLRMAEAVALQSLPILKAMQYGNLNLARKINSSFIVTIPVFKNAVAQAIIARRQALQAQALKALDDKTNEMLLKNAQTAADNMRMTAQLAGSSAIKTETISQSWEIIMNGIKDTQAIQEELTKQRENDKYTIDQVHRQYLSEIAGSK